MCGSELRRQRSFESRIDGQYGVGVGQFEDVEYFGAGSDDAELAAADLHIAVEDHEDAEPGAVEEFDAGEVEDKSFSAIVGDIADLCFNLAQAHAEGHATGQAKDSSDGIDVFEFRFENHGAGFSYVPARISQILLGTFVLRSLGCLG